MLCLGKETWISILSAKTKIDNTKIENMIDFFTFNTKNIESDISLEYFIPYKNDSLILSEAIFNLSRPQANALRLLAKKDQVCILLHKIILKMNKKIYY